MAASKGKAPATSDIPYELPWYVYRAIISVVELMEVPVMIRVEKYRPKILDDIVGNSETIERLKVIARDGNCPHIIISVSRFWNKSCFRIVPQFPQGMPGIGKTTSIHCLAHQLLGDAYKEGVLELNASDERYIASTSIYLTQRCC